MTTRLLPFAVYGTLRPGCGNDGWAWQGHATAMYDGDALLWGYKLVSAGGFPYAIADTDSLAHCALIYPHTDQYDRVLRTFDQLEGVPQHYQRVTCGVLIPEDLMVCAWTYVCTDEDVRRLPDVEGNDWLRFRRPDRFWEKVAAGEVDF